MSIRTKYQIIIRPRQMKHRHQRNSSLLQDVHKDNFYAHHRSFSFTRHNRKMSNIYSNYLSPDNYVQDTITPPMSTQFNREARYRKRIAPKEASHQLPKQKKNTKSKQKYSNQRKKKPEKLDKRQKKSNQREQKGQKKGSKQLLKQKISLQKQRQQLSGERRQGKSNQIKADNNEKFNKTQNRIGQKQKTKGKKKVRQQENIGWNWQDVIIKYADYLTLEQIAEVKQYKWIYFLGKVKERQPKWRHKKGCSDYSQDNKGHLTQRSIQKKLNLVQLLTEVKISESDSQNKKLASQDEFYKYEIGDHIAYRYEIIQSINQGSFGEVVKVFDHKTKEFLALKITKSCQDLVQQTFVQITILTHIKQRDKSSLSGVVKIKDFTIFRNHICIVFELLDGNLYELLVVNNYNGLSEDVVRIFAVQILSSLSFLQKEKIIHCDIKPENIVMKKWGKSGVKLVDFGTSCFQGKQIYQYLQSRYYRAPEVILKRQYSYPIDMWSFGCLIAELKIGEPIFAGSQNIEQLIYIANSIGLPNQKDGIYSAEFLKSSQFQQIVSLDYIGQYKSMMINGESVDRHHLFSRCKYIKTCMKTLQQRLIASKGFAKGDASFYNFLLKILAWQPDKRLKPHQALQDPWITKGLPTQIKQLYTIVNSVEYNKKIKIKNNQAKSNSKGKKGSKKSNDKKNGKQYSWDNKKYNVQWKSKDSSNQRHSIKQTNKLNNDGNYF